MGTKRRNCFGSWHVKGIFLLATLLTFFSPPAHLEADDPPTLQQAYDQASDNGVISAFNRTYLETLTANRDISVTLQGGCMDAACADRSGVSSLLGSLVINQGALILDNLVITSGPLNISGITVNALTTTSVQVSWSTDQAADSHVDYGDIVTYGNASQDGTITTSHHLVLPGLSPGTTYHFKVTSTPAYGEPVFTGDNTFSTSNFVATPWGDYGNVSVMEVTGTYDITNGDGSINPVPRQEIAKRFIQLHEDTYDFLVIFTTFPIAMPEEGTNGFYLGVKNDTQGIGKASFDNSALFGSNKLQGTIDMGDGAALAANPLKPEFEEALAGLAHQFMHRFGAYARYRKSDGSTSTALLGKDESHWSYLLDTNGSYIYGNGWRDNGGSLTSTAARSGYSQLDLYLMGMISKEEVPPMLLIDNPAIDKTQLPQLGATVNGTAQTVTIDDIIAIEGERTPNSTASQKGFKIGYVLLTTPGGSVTNELAGIEAIRSAWAGKFAALTGGKGRVTGVTPSLTLTIESPTDIATITGPDVNVSGAMINTTGAETGVLVNGITAVLSGSRFIASHVPLTEGPNTLTITAADVNGLTATATRNVTATTGNYLRIATNMESGTAPLDISISLDASFSIATPIVTISGPVSVLPAPGATAREYTATLPLEGTYTITASAVGPDSQTYSDTVTITVLSMSQLDVLLKSKWNAMRTALAAGNATGAVVNFSASTKDIFQQHFSVLSASLPQIATGIGNIRMVKADDYMAEYDLRVVIDNVTYSFYLLFVKESDGFWRIRNF